MVDFMLDAATEQTICFDHVWVAFNVLVFAADRFDSFHVAPDIWKGETTFFVDQWLGFNDFNLGIAHAHGHEELERGLCSVELVFEIRIASIEVDHAKLLGEPNLLSG